MLRSKWNVRFAVLRGGERKTSNEKFSRKSIEFIFAKRIFHTHENNNVLKTLARPPAAAAATHSKYHSHSIHNTYYSILFITYRGIESLIKQALNFLCFIVVFVFYVTLWSNLPCTHLYTHINEFCQKGRKKKYKCLLLSRIKSLRICFYIILTVQSIFSVHLKYIYQVLTWFFLRVV